MSGYSVAPRIKPLSARKSAILCVLDVGTSKVACLIARLVPIEASDVLRGVPTVVAFWASAISARAA